MTETRVRTRNDPGYTANQKRYQNGIQTHSYDTNMLSSSETMTDVVVPGFHKRIAQGEIINNACTYVKNSTYSTGGGIFNVTQSGTNYLAKGDGSMTAFLAYLLGLPNSFWHTGESPPDIQEDWSKHQALGNVDRAPYAFAEDIAEWREMLRFFKNPFGSLRDLSKEYVDYAQWSKRKKAYTLARVLADTWAEYRFGFQPAVRSIHDLMLSYIENPPEAPKRRTARGKAEWEGSSEEQYLNRNAYRFEATCTTKETFKSGILYELTNPMETGWRDTYGLRFKDIPETLWAVMPLSFMVDRMYNISQALRGLVAFLDPTIKFHAAWTTQKYERSQTRSFIEYDYLPGVTSNTVVPDIDGKTYFTYNRKTWEPSLGDVAPVLDLPNLVSSSTKVADLAALIIQRVSLKRLYEPWDNIVM